MPLGVGKDPNDPNKWIWIDSKTGLPAVQPGGPGTPFVAPSDLTPAQQRQQSQQQSPANPAQQAAVESRILDSMGRGGWNVVGRTDEMRSQASVDPKTGVSTNQLQPTGNVIWAIAGPNGQNSTVTVRPSATAAGDFDVVEPPKDLSTAGQPNTQQQVIGGKVYTPDPANPNGPWVSRAIDADAQAKAQADITKTLSDVGYTQAQINALLAKTPAEIQQALASAGLSQANTQKALNDIQISQAKLGGELAQTAAATARTGAETTQIQTATELAQAKAPAEIADLQARARASLAASGASEAQIQKTLQDIAHGNMPQPVQSTLGATLLNTASIDPTTGAVTYAPNPNFAPKTQADIAARVGQIQTLMQAKSAEVQGKVGKNNYTAEDALKEFNTWYAANVAPQQDALQAAQEDLQFARGQEVAKTRTSAYNAASAAGTGMTGAFKDMLAGKPMGQDPGFANAVSQLAKGQMPSDLNALAWKGPNPIDLYQQGTMNALKYIDPTAAAANGLPPPNLKGVDVASALGAQNYAPPGVPPPGPPAGPPPGPPPAGPPTGLLPPGYAGTNLDPNVMASGGVPPGYPRLRPPSWSQNMPNFGNPTNPWDMAPNYLPGG